MGGTGETSVRSYNLFLDTTLLAATYAGNDYAFVDQVDGTPFTSHSIMLIVDGATDVWFSFDGATDHGRVISGQPVAQDFRCAKRIWFRGTMGNAFRFWAW